MGARVVVASHAARAALALPLSFGPRDDWAPLARGAKVGALVEGLEERAVDKVGAHPGVGGLLLARDDARVLVREEGERTRVQVRANRRHDLRFAERLRAVF